MTCMSLDLGSAAIDAGTAGAENRGAFLPEEVPHSAARFAQVLALGGNALLSDFASEPIGVDRLLFKLFASGHDGLSGDHGHGSSLACHHADSESGRQGGYLAVAGVVLAVLDPQNRVVGDAAISGDLSKVADPLTKLVDNQPEKVGFMCHSASLGTNASFDKAKKPADACEHRSMEEDDARTLAANLRALMAKDRELTSDAKVAKRAGVDQKTVWRMVNEANSARLSSIAAVAHAFGLHAWQLLVPGLDPTNPPVVTMTEAEREFYARVKSAVSTLVSDIKSSDDMEKQ